MQKKKKILIIPSTNTVSHLGRALALAETLEAAGHETHLACSHLRQGWATQFHPRCHTVNELWEPSGVSYPCFQWFSDFAYIEKCVCSQEQVRREVQPDLLITIFDFVSAFSTGGVPRISINGACMLPAYEGVLGFDEQDSAARSKQQVLFEKFWSCAATAFHPAGIKRGLPLPVSAKELLVGDLNLIYEIPAVSRLRRLPPNHFFIGPLVWNGWETIGAQVPWKRTPDQPTVYLNCGTFPWAARITQTVLDAALAQGVRVIMSGGNGHDQVESSQFFYCPWLAPNAVADVADLVVFAGGTGVCYANLNQGLPSLVLPMQPEQANNGLDLELAGCGRVLVRNHLYLGDNAPYLHALQHQRLGMLLREMLELRGQAPGLVKIRQALQAYDARQSVLQYAGQFL